MCRNTRLPFYGFATSLLLIAACSGSEPEAFGPPSLGLSYDLSGVAAGDVLEVDVQVSGMLDAYGVALDLVYDPSTLEYQDASAGPFLGHDGGEVVFAAALENDTPGRLVAGASRVGSSPGLDGQGTVMTAQFLVLMDSVADLGLVLDAVHVLDSNLEEVL